MPSFPIDLRIIQKIFFLNSDCGDSRIVEINFMKRTMYDGNGLIRRNTV